MRQKQRFPIKGLAIKSAILSQLVGCILIGTFGGMWIDSYFKTKPVFLIVGLLLGLATGVYAIIKLVYHYFSGE
ncbi:AtpZ/AtpI family protein [Metabacillus malikii]|uniref:F0F1-type ATP synthase assembly protein I n=1 Tax=Metabacillus malikii TaxID=1504265 RepID=A0ABT9ZJI1_9BACI|nr:AtpZ/AtpI family protein [Metabacillus malikii]MDQ0232125.1 F0F1-type ATP synthase assembly protein I [Metabacillus malikii]